MDGWKYGRRSPSRAAGKQTWGQPVTCQLESITLATAMKRKNASVLVYLRLKTMLLKHRQRRWASIPHHRRESRQFNARPFDASQQTSLMCSRLTRWPRRRWRILSRCRRGQSDDGSRHLRSRYWQEAVVSGHKITVTLLLKPNVFSETAGIKWHFTYR